MQEQEDGEAILSFIHYLRYKAIPSTYPAKFQFITDCKMKINNIECYRTAYTTASFKALDLKVQKDLYIGYLPEDIDLIEIAQELNRLCIVDDRIYNQKYLPWGVQYICYRPLPLHYNMEENYDLCGRKYMQANAWMCGFKIVRVHGPISYLTCDIIKNECKLYTIYIKIPSAYKDITILAYD